MKLRVILPLKRAITFAILVLDKPVGMRHLALADVIQWQADRLVWKAQVVQSHAIVMG